MGNPVINYKQITTLITMDQFNQINDTAVAAGLPKSQVYRYVIAQGLPITRKLLGMLEPIQDNTPVS